MQLPPAPSPQNWVALSAIADHLRDHQTPPTFQELAAQLQLGSPRAAQSEIRQLAQLGLLKFRRRGSRGIAARSIRLTPRGQSALACFRAVGHTRLAHGHDELALTRHQLDLARAAELPVDAFPRRKERGKIILRCFDWQERNFWGEKILRIMA